MPLRWLRKPQSWSVPDGASLLVAAGPQYRLVRRSPALGGAEAECAGAPRRLERRLSPERAGHGRLRRDLRRGRARRLRERRRLGEALLRVLAAARADGGLGRDQACPTTATPSWSTVRRSGCGSRGSARRSRSMPRPTAATGASSATSRSRAPASRRSGSPRSRRWAKAVPSRSSRSPTRRRGSATCGAASRAADRSTCASGDEMRRAPESYSWMTEIGGTVQSSRRHHDSQDGQQVPGCEVIPPHPARHLLRAKDLVDARYREPLDVAQLARDCAALAGALQPRVPPRLRRDAASVPPDPPAGARGGAAAQHRPLGRRHLLHGRAAAASGRSRRASAGSTG